MSKLLCLHFILKLLAQTNIYKLLKQFYCNNTPSMPSNYGLGRGPFLPEGGYRTYLEVGI